MTVWEAISGRGVIGRFFFKNPRRKTSLLIPNSMFRFWKVLAPELETSRIVNSTRPSKKQMFPGILISKRDDIPWSPRSPDLIPDFSLWGYLKHKVYSSNTRNIDQLKENTRDEMAV